MNRLQSSALCGIALLIASALAGWLWTVVGPASTFFGGAAFTVIAWVAFMGYGRKAAALPGT